MKVFMVRTRNTITSLISRSGSGAFDEFPPSTKLVYKMLEGEGEYTQKKLVAETMLAVWTVRHALSQLEEEGFVEDHVSFEDAR